MEQTTAYQVYEKYKCILKARGGNIKSEWSAGNSHRRSAGQQRLSKMDTDTLLSCCDRSTMGEHLSKMNSISTVSQYKCHKLRRPWASSFPIPSSEVSKRELASKISIGSRKALSTRILTWERPFCHTPNLPHCETMCFHAHMLSQLLSLLVWLQKGIFSLVTNNKQYNSSPMPVSRVTPKCHSTRRSFPTVS